LAIHIQTHAEANYYSVVRDYCGHGIGEEFHEEPQVLHYGKPDTGLELLEGMTFTIEPMVNAGKHGTKLKRDGWTVETQRWPPVLPVGTHMAGDQPMAVKCLPLAAKSLQPATSNEPN
jgi:Xaa-Pro aminopeptidase